MNIGDRVPFRKDVCSRFKDLKQKNEECLFGNVVSYDEKMVCILYMRQFFFVKRQDIEKIAEEIENK